MEAANRIQGLSSQSQSLTIEGATTTSSMWVWNGIASPAFVTFAVTSLRLVGELQHWPSPLFSSGAADATEWNIRRKGNVREAESNGNSRVQGKDFGYLIEN